MRLTNVELKGFKSFADRTIINFNQNVTGIVGPNGCGKSNVVDAIRWVLGEQKSKTLRLEKMDNIIFNGTKDRHPANIASVSMTLENTKNILPTEYGSITVTRTISRDGKSEYLLNGVACRLKDIKDLFLDTGISTDTYAIIELKMIDDILNNVDKARRGLLEQAAGISKYKTRKKETLSKLNNTESDLTRVEDLLYEINKSLKGLESQARRAKRYKVLKEEYKELTLQLSSFELMDINETTQKQLKEIQNKQDEIVRIETAITLLEADLQKNKLLIEEKEKLLSDEQKALNRLMNIIQETEKSIELFKQKEQFQKDRKFQLGRNVDDLKSKMTFVQHEIKDISQETEKIQAENLPLKEKLEQEKQLIEERRNSNLQLREQLQNAESQYRNIEQKIFQMEKTLAVKQSELENQLRYQKQSHSENEERERQLEKIIEEVGTFESKIQKQTQLLTDIEQKEADNILQIESLEKDLELKREKLTEINRSLDAKKNEHKLTKNMVDSLEGFPEAIKYLKKSAEWLKNSLLLSDIIYSEEQYRAAIETVLQPYLNSFVVDTFDDAMRGIHLLQSVGKGKAAFLVLEMYNQDQKTHKNQLPEGMIPLSEVVESDDLYKRLIQQLLNGIYIAKNDFDLEQWEIPSDFSGQIVSSNGHLLKSPLQISGGSVGLFEGKRLGRLKNLEKLGKEIESLEKEVLEHKKTVQDIQVQLTSLRNQSYKKTIERERREVVEMEKSLASKKSRIESFKEIVQKNRDRQNEVQANVKRIEAELLPLKEQIADSSSELQKMKENTSSIDKVFRDASDGFSQMQQAYNQQHIFYIQQENKAKSLIEKQSFKTNQYEDFVKQTALYTEEIESIEKSNLELVDKIKKQEEALLELFSKRETLASALNKKEEGFFVLRKGVQTIENNIRENEKLRRVEEERIQKIKDDYNQQKVRLNVLKEKLSYEFNIDLDDFLEELKEPETDKETLNARLDKAKKQLSQFGEVNPMAEEAYDEMKERFEFITAQKQDLEDAKVSLLKTIHEVDTAAKGQFLETFAEVRENFIKVFRSMFTKDDNCDLIIVDPEDILESDIEITAKPKGKRPQSVNQLSGGEKTLTALSLLFALYLYKPAPFCILDEVDAPLDDNNVGKFNNAIREFSQNSQFIVVTHNKSTMAEVDTIYGVTMAKQGISKVVPVDFSHLN
ncbi:MAG: chromosome segregation protein SMC [Chitinophagales bacterium]|nr:chromosome segregation protein SMC [Chitinophagales bacterium]